MFYLMIGMAALFFFYRNKGAEPGRHAGRVPMDDNTGSWTSIVQKGQVLVPEPFTSIGGYPIACDGRDFMYSPDVDEEQGYDHQMENPQEIPAGL
jgi:hypothetical protein